MANIIDYIGWRGDLTFEQSGFCKIDALVFAWLSYFEAEKLEEKGIFCQNMTISEIVDICEKVDGVIVKPGTIEGIIPGVSAKYLMKVVSRSERYKDIVVTGFQAVNDFENSIQFAAFSYNVCGAEVIAFRGTDASVAGWKEDCKLSYELEVPAQQLAVNYLNSRNAAQYVITGHSKGGNLSIYAASFCQQDQAARIASIFNFDGPGFCFDINTAPNYLFLKDCIESYLPKDSIVGMLLNHVDNYIVIKSDMTSIMQHDALFWRVFGREFLYVEKNSAQSSLIDNTLSDWLSKISPSERKEFVEALFSVFEQADIKYFTDLTQNTLRQIPAIISQLNTLDSEKKKMIYTFIGQLIKSSGTGIIQTVTASPAVENIKKVFGGGSLFKR